MIIAGTGHRPHKLGGYDHGTYMRLVKLAQTALQAQKPDHVISGGALGWDMALAAAANVLSIPYTIAMPFVGQQLRWPEESQLRYERMCELAEKVEIVCNGGYAAWKMQHRNEWMVDHADHMLVLWDGSSGGTGNCMKYIEQKQKPFTNLWKQWEIKA